MCGCGRKSFSAITKSNGLAPQASPFMGGQLNMSDLCEQDNMVKIRYAGPTGNHLVGSPLRKVGTYGMHTNGDVFCVHVDDQKTAPAIFVLLEPKPELKPEPKLEPEAESVDEVGGEKRSTEKQRGRPRKEEAHD